MLIRFLFKGSLTLALLVLLGLGLYLLETPQKQEQLLASYSYQGPTQAVPGNPKLVRIEVIVRDSPSAAGVQIQSVDFNGQGIPLQPRDIYGNRGTGSFQLPPGKYTLRWSVTRDKLLWPRTLDHEEEVTVDPRDLWLQIEIIGEEVSIR
jgi:hypothetical protein